MIDPNKPLELIGAAVSNRKVTLLAVTKSHNLLVEIAESASEWFLFDKTGKFLKSDDGSGSALKLGNAIQITSGFYLLDPHGQPTNARGLVSLDLALSEYPSAAYFIEIVSHDGQPKEAHIHVRTRPDTQ